MKRSGVIKLTIQKIQQINSGFWRYYSVPGGRIIFVPESNIETESQFCKWIYDTWGQGHYKIMANKKKHKGFWLFWKGEISVDGFIRDPPRDKEVEKLKEEKMEAEVSGDVEEVDSIDDEIQWLKDKQKKKRKGFIGWIKAQTPGVLHSYEDWEKI